MTVPPFTAFRFEVLLELHDPVDGFTDPLCDAAFAECDGLEMTMEPMTIESGGVNDRQVHLIGPVKFAQLTLKRGMTSDLQLWNWMALMAQGKAIPAAGTVTMWDSDATPVIEFALQNCLPVRMRAPALRASDGAIAIEELALVYETMSVTPAGSGGFGVGAGISASAAFQAGASAGFSASASAGFSASASAGFSAGASVGGGISL